MSELLTSILGEDGALKKAYPAFTPRKAQLSMAEAVEQALNAHSVLVVEAGTGVGKTFAYLIPALLHDNKVVISTGTKNLQDQLFQKDLPILQKFLAVNKKIVLLKGRSNYACLYRLNAPVQQTLFESKEVLNDFSRINAWAKITNTGDLHELRDFSEDAPIWQHVTSTAENCLGSECEWYDKCFVVKSRREALMADVVVINHHLFFADLSLKEESVGSLLPDVEAVIFDEAHQLYEAASSFLSERFSSRQLLLLLRDIQSEYAMLGNDHPDILRLMISLKQVIANLRIAFGESGRRDAWFEVAKHGLVKTHIDLLQKELLELTDCLKEQGQRSKGLENAWERSTAFTRFLDDLLMSGSESKTTSMNVVHWFETFLTGFMIYKTPVDLSEHLSLVMNNPKKSWIYTSATLDAGFGVEHFTHPLGIIPQQVMMLDSPYNYREQSRLYFPRYLPAVTDTQFMAHWIKAVMPLIEAAEGRTFLLFTSYRAMQEAHELLRYSDFTLLIQGQTTKQALLDAFKTSRRSVLLGTSSFWQGVDVQGTALCCVCIDKLPFASPADPVTKARINAYQASGRDPFYAYQLPQAVIMLKQGVGRLIRSEVDRGVLVIGDLRLLTRHYGAAFLKAMPKSLLLRDEEKVVAFLRSIR